MTKKNVSILNTSVNNLTQLELLEKLSHGGVVITPNVDHLMLLQKDREFHKAYQIADYCVCDSKILQYASKFLGTPIIEKISGSDLLSAYYLYYKNDENVKIFLLGAAEGVAEKAQERINKKVKRKIVVEAYSPSMGFEKSEAECQKIVDMINQSDATVLAIGVGSPKQEKWIAKYRSQLTKIKTFLAIGATIDFEAGHKARAPKWMSEIGLEWAYRLLCEPKRLWKRYLVDGVPFFWLLLQQKLNLYQSPSFRIPIGEILLEKRLISVEALNNVLEIQQELDSEIKLGEILFHLGLITQEELAKALLEQRLYDSTHQPPRLFLGELLVQKKLISPEEINNVLEVQEALDSKIELDKYTYSLA